VFWAAHEASDSDAYNAYRIRIEAEGPFGLIEPLEYVITVDDLEGLPAEVSTRLPLSCAR
jgi:hypothetical protein